MTSLGAVDESVVGSGQSFRTADDRGSFAALFRQRTEIGALEFVESKADSIRGNHVHLYTTENLYVAIGKVTLHLQDTATGETEVLALAAGDIATVQPGVAHAIHAHEWSVLLAVAEGGDPLVDRRQVKVRTMP